MLVWGVTAPHRCHRRFAGPSAWRGAVAWSTAPLDPTKSPGSTSLTPDRVHVSLRETVPAYPPGPLNLALEAWM